MTAPASDDAHPHDAPTQILADRFELRRVLGTGGMSTVWSAWDRRLGRTVAIKTLRDDVSEAHADRIRREARAAARIDDRRVVTVLDLEHDADGNPFLVLEAHEGATLADELRDGPLPAQRAERLVGDLLGGLAAAHRCGVLHRDIKPSNLLLAGDGYRLTDFGIASLDDDTATTGDLMGTLVYLAPERFDGQPATPRSDVFAAAAVLYEVFTSRQPFRAPTVAESLERLRRGDIPPLPAHVSPTVAGAIVAALHPDPDRRPADAAELEQLVRGEDADRTEPLPVVEARAVDATRADRAVVPPPDPVRRAAAAGEDTVLIDPTTTTEAPVPASPPPAAGHPPARQQAGWWDHPPLRRWRGLASRPQAIAIAVAVVIVLAVVIIAANRDSGTTPDIGPEEDPAIALDQYLDRIREIGR